ncbi:conserved hypothetical protein [Paraburkholderia piptadeniae]|uniref:Uncharacterized protein n=1 Tax=Paraburkholderia piptadeniae TaxID=1701573 RepID=A0A1N7S8W3_9BURK|nr:hypothetical protein [Paraburkholderia piptadeniae]SIT43761.1 conserved hypothetical protein [Paraburkholderia piptadeniae]
MPRNPILIGQAVEIDLLQPQVRAMLNNEGFYIGGDTKQERLMVALVSQGGRVFCLKVDTELEPSRFMPSLTLHGPYGPRPPAVIDELVELLSKAHAAIDGLFAQLITKEPDFCPSQSEYWADMVAINEAVKHARGES